MVRFGFLWLFMSFRVSYNPRAEDMKRDEEADERHKCSTGIGNYYYPDYKITAAVRGQVC